MKKIYRNTPQLVIFMYTSVLAGYAAACTHLGSTMEPRLALTRHTLGSFVCYCPFETMTPEVESCRHKSCIHRHGAQIERPHP